MLDLSLRFAAEASAAAPIIMIPFPNSGSSLAWYYLSVGLKWNKGLGKAVGNASDPPVITISPHSPGF